MSTRIDVARLKPVKPSKKSRIEITKDFVVVFGGRDETHVRCVFPLDSESEVYCTYNTDERGGRIMKSIILTFLPSSSGHLNCSLHNIRIYCYSADVILCYAYVFCNSKDKGDIRGWL